MATLTKDLSSKANLIRVANPLIYSDPLNQALLDPSWLTIDNSGYPGASTSMIGGALSITAGGTDVWTTADQFFAVYRHMAGDFTAIIKLKTAIGGDAAWRKIGLMVRNDMTKPGVSTGYAMIGATSNNGYTFQSDSDNNGLLDATAQVSSVVLPVYLKLVKSGKTISGYYSTDGANYTLISSATLSSVNAIQDVGIFVCSHAGASTATATFNDFVLLDTNGQLDFALANLGAYQGTFWSHSVKAYIQQVPFHKRYAYQIYDATGLNYVTTWSTDVITDDGMSFPTFRGVINGGFGEMIVRLARNYDNFGEGNDVSLNNVVKLYCYDRDAPNGVLIYSGYISGYRPVLDGVDEYVEVTILHDIGRLTHIMLRDAASSTFVTFSGVDPSQMLKNVIDYARVDGSPIQYNDASVDMTNTTAVYSFSLMTIKEALDVIIQLTPLNWYWTVDVNNIIQLHLANTVTADHTLIIGKHITYIETWRRIEDLVNRVYFIGQGNMFRQYSATGSISAYGLYALKNSDKNVLFSPTADVIANTILNNKSNPEIRTLVKVLDNNGLNSGIGYDIESIRVGQTINIRNLKQGQKTISYWDQFMWDTDVWDQTLSSSAADIIQIQAITYYPDYIQIEASSRQPEVTRRIEDISKQLQNEQAAGINGSPSIIS